MGVARHTYLKEWKRIRGDLGQKGQSAPVLHMVTKRNAASVPDAARGAMAATVPIPGGRPEIYAAKGMLKKLGHAKTNMDRNTIDHELIHTAQKPELWNLGNGPAAERGAYRLAKAIARNNPKARKKAYNNLSPWVRKGQFK